VGVGLGWGRRKAEEGGGLAQMVAVGGVRKRQVGGSEVLNTLGTPSWRRPVSVSTLANVRVHQANTWVECLNPKPQTLDPGHSALNPEL
jgi:hypothetical protein